MLKYSYFPFFIPLDPTDIVIISRNGEVQVLKLDTDNNELDCEIPPYPLKIRYGAAGVITAHDQKITLCGGFDDNFGTTNKCFQFNEDSWQWEEIHSMLTERNDHTLIERKNQLYATGGYDRYSYVNTAEKWSKGSWQKIQDLPTTLRRPCSVGLNETTFLTTGGYSQSKGKVSE